MRRREFIALLSGAATWPVAVRAQSSRKLPRIGFFSVVARERNQQMIDAFVNSLRELGFVENQDFDFVYRSADGHLDRLPTLADEMIALQPDVILATVTPTVVVLKARSQTIPIVCVARHRRRGDRVRRPDIRVWHKADMRTVLSDLRFRR
jgi:putative tryptophan/tyrosine transport system substrate-binding protein